MDNSSLKEKFSVPPKIVSSECKIINIEYYRLPIYLSGRYRKLSRNVSQTPWHVGNDDDEDNRIGSTSIEELLIPYFLPNIGSKDYTFISSGREDLDVRMLGLGRPFVIEISNAKNYQFSESQVKDMMENINRSTNLINIRDLQFIDKDSVDQIKENKDSKKKTL